MSVVARGRDGSDHLLGGDKQDEDRTGKQDVGPGEGAAVDGLAGPLMALG